MLIEPCIQDDFGPGDIIAEAMGDCVQEFLVALEWDETRTGEPMAARSHLMSVQLIDMSEEIPEGAPDVSTLFDLRFGLVWRRSGDSFIVSEPDWSLETSRRLIAPDDRPRVLDLVREAARQLVEHVGPDIVTMSTFDRNLPAKALTKYQRISDTLARVGYIQEPLMSERTDATAGCSVPVRLRRKAALRRTLVWLTRHHVGRPVERRQTRTTTDHVVA